MLHKKFLLAKTEIAGKNYALAKKLLDEISYNKLSEASKNLLAALYERLPRSIDKNSEADTPFKVTSLSDLDKQDIRPGISIVSCCMNRNTNLMKALATWVKLPVDEIIIVDWSSKTPVLESVKAFDDARIKILRVDNESKWVLTYGFNVGLRFASYSKIFKFDADIEVSEDFLELNNFSNKEFVRGYWKSALDEGLDSQVYVNGSFGAHKKHLKEIGYYNELIRTYGWDDSDIYERLASQCGLRTTYLDFRSVVHMEQEESSRVAHQDVVTENFLGIVPTTDFNNQRNKFIGRTTDYWETSRLQNYSIEQVNSKCWELKRLSQTIHIPNYIANDAHKYAALHFLWNRQPQVIKKASSEVALAKFLLSEYEAKINYEISQTILGEVESEHIVLCFDGSRSYSDFLIESIDISEGKKRTVFAVAQGDCYSHKRLGNVNAFVEVLVLPYEFFTVIADQRAANNLLPLKPETVSIETADLSSEFSKLFKPKVYVDAQHGLGNRLRAIGSAAAIAEKSGRELVIVWQSDHHCECEFSDLFDYSGEIITQSFVNDANKYMDVYNYMEIEQGACKDKLVEISGDKHLYLRAAYTFNSPLSDWDSENEFIKSLTPSKQVLSLIAPFNVDGYIAAHIRMEAGAGLDHNTYDSVANWTQEGHDELHFWRDKSHYSAFIKRIDQLIDNDTNLKLFVATDLQETYDIFQKYYGDRLVYLKRDVFDRSKEQIIYALADVLLLSKCSKLLGSTWSSFSEAAMRLSDTYSEIEMSGRDF